MVPTEPFLTDLQSYQNNTNNNIIMEMKKYISPEMELVDLKPEGVLCTSGNDNSLTLDLEDYKPSLGNW